MPDTLKATDKELLIDAHDRCGKQQFQKPNRRVVILEKQRQRPAEEHMSHRKIKQHEQKEHRGKQSVLQCIQLLPA